MSTDPEKTAVLPLCGNCKWWASKSNDALFHGRPCDKLSDYPSAVSLAWTKDKEGAWGWLITRANFGCVLFEEKPE